MLHVQSTRTISAAPATVWAALADYMAIDVIAPEVVKVDVLSENTTGLGAKRRCHFPNGTSLVEEAITWNEGLGYRAAMLEMGKIPFKTAQAEIRLTPTSAGKTNVHWSIDYQPKFGPLGWLMGAILMKPQLRKVLNGNLRGLNDHVTGHASAIPQPF
ncbi:SRPBCC family protein [uncultured Shimia sp.]|uniref:SRPBCC family protein n=1 Tax=uncultured Shimia sp. TaxID=573152 RepID=UPI002631C83A|nr:SRPBCC family protein [uncultured Shimia sp.]